MVNMHLTIEDQCEFLKYWEGESVLDLIIASSLDVFASTILEGCTIKITDVNASNGNKVFELRNY